MQRVRILMSALNWACRLDLAPHHRPLLCQLHLKSIVLARCTSTHRSSISMQYPMRIGGPILAIVAMRVDSRPAMRESGASPGLGGRGGA